MNHIMSAILICVCLMSSALLGSYLRERLPPVHLSEESISVVKLATNLVTTLSALVLGLLVSSAKGTFDTANAELVTSAADILQFDHILVHYGPPAQDIRRHLKLNVADTLQALRSRNTAQLAGLASPAAMSRSEAFERDLESLTPIDPTHNDLKTRALQKMDEVFAMRWLILLRADSSIPPSMLVILVAWLSVIFGTFGLFSARNGTLIVVLMTCALSVSAAILLIEELNRPLDGLIGVSLAPLQDALNRLSQ